MDEVDLPDFSGKLLQVFLTHVGASKYAVESFLLEYTEWREVGGRLFVAGRIPEVRMNGWIAGREAAVAWDCVSSYVLFRSREQYEENVARYKPSLIERLRG